MSWLDTLEDLYKNRDFSAMTADEREHAARDLINLSGLASCTLTAAPLPFSELILTTPVHIAMVIGVGHVYGRHLSKTEASRIFIELAAAAGASLAARSVWIALSKLIAPGFGVFLVLPYVYAVTWGLGRLAMQYFDDPETSPEHLRQKFGEFVDEGKKGFRMDAFKDFMKRKGQEVRDFTDSDRARPAAASSDAVEASWDEGPVGATTNKSEKAKRPTKPPATKRTPEKKQETTRHPPRASGAKAPTPNTKVKAKSAPGRQGASRGAGRTGRRSK
ncbi:MAG: hypothetical protein ABIJ09_19810 [Pseudomonadota bacterium]